MASAVRFEVTAESFGTLIRLNAPEVRNAMNRETATALLDVIEAPDPGALVLCADGPDFCAGADVGELRAASEADRLSDHVASMTDTFHSVVAALASTPRPTVAVVTGSAAGGGMGLALACDVCVAGRSASLVPAYLALGATPDGGATALLARAIGPANAKAALLLGRPIAAESALGGLVFHEVVDDDDAEQRAREIAGRLNASNPLAVRATKQLVESAWTSDVTGQVDRERRAAIANARDAGFAQGIQQFFQRREKVR